VKECGGTSGGGSVTSEQRTGVFFFRRGGKGTGKSGRK